MSKRHFQREYDKNRWSLSCLDKDRFKGTNLVSNVIVTDNSSITKPASKVMLGGVISLVGSLASNIVIASLYGAGAHMDAYLTAMVIPTFLQIIIFWNLSFVLIPAFIEAEVNGGEQDAWALVGTFFWITMVILLVISIVGAVFSTVIIGMVAPGFQGEKSVLAAQMLSVLMFTAPFAGLSTLTVGIQNARNHFFWPSIAPAIGSLANVIILITLSRAIGPMSLCWGYFAATIFQAGATSIPILSKIWKKSLHLTDSRVVTIGRLILPLIIFGMFTSISPVVERYFSSGLPDGQIAYMGYANKISNIFVLLIASSIATVMFPSMARAYSQEGIHGLSQKNDFGLRLTFAIAFPTVLIVSAVAVPMIEILFERGAFNHSMTLGVERIIFAYLLGNVLFRMITNIFQRSFYVLKDTITQPVVSFILLILYIITAPFFLERWGYAGLAWSSAIRSGLGIIILWIVLIFRFPKDNLMEIFSYILKYGMAAVGAYTIGRLLVFELAHTSAFLQLLIGGLVGILIYVAILNFLEKEILLPLFEMLGLRFIIVIVEKLQNRKDILFQRRL